MQRDPREWGWDPASLNKADSARSLLVGRGRPVKRGCATSASERDTPGNTALHSTVLRARLGAPRPKPRSPCSAAVFRAVALGVLAVGQAGTSPLHRPTAAAGRVQVPALAWTSREASPACH